MMSVSQSDKQRFAEMVYWNGLPVPRDASVVFQQMLDIFPCLHGNQDFVGKKRTEGHDVFVRLLQIGEYAEALNFMDILVSATPADNYTSMACSTIVELSNYIITQIKRDPEVWRDSALRDCYFQLIEVSGQLFCYKDGTFPNPLTAKDVQTAAFSNDLPLYKTCTGFGFSNQPHLFTLEVFNRLMTPALCGDFEYQTYLFDQALAQAKTLSKTDIALGQQFFWRDVLPVVDQLDGDNKRVFLNRALHLGCVLFEPGNVPALKKALADRKLKFMIMNAPALLLRAKQEGLEITVAQYKAALKPLEKVAVLVGRAWQGTMSHEEWKGLRETLNELLDGVDVVELYRRKIPEQLVSVFAELMPEKGWMEKATEEGLTNILMDDLGL